MGNLQLTKEQMTKIAVSALFAGLFIYLYLNYFWLPLSRKISENRQRIESISNDISQAKQQKAKYKDLEAELVRLGQEKEAAQKKLPKDRKVPDLIRTLTTLSKKCNVGISSINSPSVSREEYFTRVSYSLTVKGSYHAIGKFLTALGIEERVFTPENLVLSGAGSDGSLSAVFSLVTYQYNN